MQNNGILYGVIILNYNTSSDCKKAVRSIEECAVTGDYKICVVDGGSTKEGEREAILDLSKDDDHVISVVLDENRGYAYGNDEGYKTLKEQCGFRYTVIMNPDVIVETKGLIESIIEELDKDEDGTLVGGQPLISSVGSPHLANEQINIRKVFTYNDFLISNFWLTRRVFKKKFEEMTYVAERPYKGHIFYEVPYGAFFIIRSDVFEEVGLFDTDTFLYAEEFILGYKIKQLGKRFMLFSEFVVDHYQGKASGSHGGMSIRTLRNTMDAVSVYMKKYLNVRKAGVAWYRFVCYFNRYTEWIEHSLVYLFKWFKRK